MHNASNRMKCVVHLATHNTCSHDTTAFFLPPVSVFLSLVSIRPFCMQTNDFPALSLIARCSQKENVKQFSVLMCFVEEVLHPKGDASPINHEHQGKVWEEIKQSICISGRHKNVHHDAAHSLRLVFLIVDCFTVKQFYTRMPFPSLCRCKNTSCKRRSDGTAACLLRTEVLGGFFNTVSYFAMWSQKFGTQLGNMFPAACFSMKVVLFNC